jgi:hypothetical protein
MVVLAASHGSDSGSFIRHPVPIQHGELGLGYYPNGRSEQCSGISWVLFLWYLARIMETHVNVMGDIV